MRKPIVLLVALGLLFSLASCAGGFPTPTATAIPLAATAAPSPRPTRIVATATKMPSTPMSATETPTPLTPVGLSHLDDMLAQRAAQGFLDRLVEGEAASTFRLYLTDRAREGEAGRTLARFTGADLRLLDATLLEFKRATALSYEARALLRWAETGNTSPATQTMTLRLAYQRGLWLIDDITLGDLRLVTPTPNPSAAAGAAPPAPRLDGRLVFQVSSGGHIYIINADGSGLRRLTDGLDPAWSPAPLTTAEVGNTQIAFTRWRHPWGAYLIRPDGSGETRVVDGIRLKEVAWSPDGSRLLFTINCGSDEPIEICFSGFCFTLPPFSVGQIWMADLGTGDFLSLPLDDRVVHAPTWSPTQGRIVYAGDRGLAWIELPEAGSAGGWEEVRNGRFEGGSVWDTSPAFSPNGQQIAFMGRVHNHWEVFVMKADGSGRRQLTHSASKLKDPPSNVAPAWSPDGRYLAFLSNRDGPWRIYVMNNDGSGQRPMFGAKLDGLGIRYEWATERVISWGR